MKNRIKVTHKGVTVYISILQTTKRGKPYTEYVITDYTSGKRVRHVRAGEEAARVKAREVSEARSAGATVATSSPHLLIVAIKRFRNAGMQNTPNTCLVLSISATCLKVKEPQAGKRIHDVS